MPSFYGEYDHMGLDTYISSAAVDVAKAVDTPVQDSLNQMQNVHIAQVQAQEQAQTRAAGGPVIS